MKKQNTITVEPVKGRKLPIENMPRRYVTKKMSVPNRAYYRRAIRRGDIKKITPAATPSTED